MHEFYQMPLFVKLKVKNIEKSKVWYKNVLDFDSLFDFPDDKGTISMTHLRGEKYQDLMLIKDEKVNASSSVIINLFSNNIHNIYQSALENKATIIQEPTVTPWNAKELTIKDPDGYIFTITESIDSDKSFDSVIENVKGKLDRKE
ncbi:MULTISPECIES: VOC family protein [Lysinibacillus]|uniref:VOC family protein n=1 Tax=Lysinibacillus TaxID=400634 RepID=UPI00257FA791|nr:MULTISPECIES: VOC family protein [Lysinibacillus]